MGLGANNPNGRVTCKHGEDAHWGKKQKQLRTDEACAEETPLVKANTRLLHTQAFTSDCHRMDRRIGDREELIAF